jgi:hypothetical protein
MFQACTTPCLSSVSQFSRTQCERARLLLHQCPATTQVKNWQADTTAVLTVQTHTGHSRQQTTEASTTQTAKTAAENLQHAGPAAASPHHINIHCTYSRAPRQQHSTARTTCLQLSLPDAPACWHAHSTTTLSKLLPAQTELMYTVFSTAVFISTCSSLTLFQQQTFPPSHSFARAQGQKCESSRALQEAQ